MKISSSSEFREKEKRLQLPKTELELDNLRMIYETIECLYHRQQFRAVCKLWRSSVPKNINNRGCILSSILPVKIPSELDNITPFLVATTTFVIRPTKGEFKDVASLLTVEEINPGFLTPRYPLSTSLHQNSSGCLNLLETRVSVLAQGFKIRLLGARQNAKEKGKGGYEPEFNEKFPYDTKKLLLLNESNPSSDGDLWAVMLYPMGVVWLFSVKKGEFWELLVDGENSKCYDIVKFKDEVTLYGIDEVGSVFRVHYVDRMKGIVTKHDIDKGQDEIVRVNHNIVKGIGESGEKRLVVKNEELYMVVRNTGNAIFSFSVYKMDEVRKVWEKVPSLGNRMMFFVGHDVSFCASLQDFQGLEGSCEQRSPENCIFFSKGSFPVYGDGVFDNDKLLFEYGSNGADLSIGQYFLGDETATRLSEPAYELMFSPNRIGRSRKFLEEVGPS